MSKRKEIEDCVKYECCVLSTGMSLHEHADDMIERCSLESKLFEPGDVYELASLFHNLGSDGNYGLRYQVDVGKLEKLAEPDFKGNNWINTFDQNMHKFCDGTPLTYYDSYSTITFPYNESDDEYRREFQRDAGLGAARAAVFFVFEYILNTDQR